MSRLYLGVDGGQSSTTALIADERGLIVGHGRSGPCNHVKGAGAGEKFKRVVAECVEDACKEAGLSCEAVQFSAACLGFSGGPGDKRSLTEALIRSERFHITHDAEIALTGATAGEPGIIVISGTGSMAYGRNAAGKFARAGGWGYIFGDEGGAFDIVRAALRAALRFEEGWGEATSLTRRLCHALHLDTANEMLHAFYTAEYPRSKVASLAPLVSEEAEAGDSVAVNILRAAAAQLADLVTAVHGQLFENPEKQCRIVPIGGTFSSSLLRESLNQQLQSRLHYSLGQARMGPAAGALLQALRMDGNPAFPNGGALLFA